VDGLAGPNTRAAVRAYQRDKGEAADGKITEDLVNRLSGEVVAEEARRLAEIEKRR
jgi:peptidoglycan hydrolase-like protein with peptidoglycan-binding domain